MQRNLIGTPSRAQRFWRLAGGLFKVLFVSYAVFISYVHFSGDNPLPVPDNGSRIFVTPSLAARNDVVQVLDYFGLHPRFKLDTVSADRAIMRDGTIINTTDPKMLERLGNPSAGLALVSSNPLEDARRAGDLLMLKGWNVQVHEDLEPEAPKGSIVFLTSDAFGGWALLFRKPVMQMGPPPPRWYPEMSPAEWLGITGLIGLFGTLVTWLAIFKLIPQSDEDEDPEGCLGCTTFGIYVFWGLIIAGLLSGVVLWISGDASWASFLKGYLICLGMAIATYGIANKYYAPAK